MLITFSAARVVGENGYTKPVMLQSSNSLISAFSLVLFSPALLLRSRYVTFYALRLTSMFYNLTNHATSRNETCNFMLPFSSVIKLIISKESRLELR